MEGDFPFRGRDPGGDRDELSADGAAACFAQVGVGEGADGKREVKAMVATTGHAALAVKFPESRCASKGSDAPPASVRSCS